MLRMIIGLLILLCLVAWVPWDLVMNWFKAVSFRWFVYVLYWLLKIVLSGVLDSPMGWFVFDLFLKFVGLCMYKILSSMVVYGDNEWDDYMFWVSIEMMKMVVWMCNMSQAFGMYKGMESGGDRFAMARLHGWMRMSLMVIYSEAFRDGGWRKVEGYRDLMDSVIPARLSDLSFSSLWVLSSRQGDLSGMIGWSKMTIRGEDEDGWYVYDVFNGEVNSIRSVIMTELLGVWEGKSEELKNQYPSWLVASLAGWYDISLLEGGWTKVYLLREVLTGETGDDEVTKEALILLAEWCYQNKERDKGVAWEAFVQSTEWKKKL